MTEVTLLAIVIVFIALLIAIIHFYDRYLVKEIDLYEKRLVKKGIFKRHLLKIKKNKNRPIKTSNFLRPYGNLYKAF